MKSTPILPSGAFFPKTANGYILNPCSLQFIDRRYQPLLKEIVAAYVDQEGANLHSVYLRGSVPRGMTIGDCDLDTFALVFSETDRWRKPDWSDVYFEKWKTAYPFVKTVEVALASYAPVLRTLPEAEKPEGATTNARLSMILKTQSLCLYGTDIIPKIPMYRPDVSMMLAKDWLAEDLSAFAKNKKDKPLQQQFLKTLIRSGFELVMPRIQQYTPDLYLCYRSFADYYPKKEPLMRNALFYYLNPKKKNSSDLEASAVSLGKWLLKKFSQEEDGKTKGSQDNQTPKVNN